MARLLTRGSRGLQLQAHVVELNRLQFIHATLAADYVALVAVLLGDQFGWDRD